MKKTMKIFYIAPEVAPFAKTYAVADVAGAFPKALKEMGHDVRVMMPNYKCVNARKYVLRDVIRLKDMRVPEWQDEVLVSAKSAFLPNSKVQIYFLDNKELFVRDGLYADSQKGKVFADNDERFMVFIKGCVETLKMLHWQPDVIHCNDWQSGFLPILLKMGGDEDGFFKNTKIVFSLFDFQTETTISKSALEKAGLDTSQFSADEVDASGNVDVLKTAISRSDMIVVENKDRALGKQLKGEPVSDKIKALLASASDKLVELGSGIDHSVWDPSSDKFLKSKYVIESVEKKQDNKKALLANLDLTYDAKSPLVYVHADAEATTQEDDLTQIIPEMLEMGISVVLLSRGQNGKEQELAAYNEKYPNHFLLQKYENDLAHQLMAGADFYLAPAWEEPMISNHLIGMRYGTIPLVKDDGDFSETIKDFSKSAKNATGFVFNGSEERGIVSILKTALELYQNTDKWENLIKNAMKQDYSWHSVGPQYIEKLSRLF